MTTDYTFKKHKLSTAERMWLEEAARPGFFPRRALTKLEGKIPADFRPDAIDSRLYLGITIRPIGLWHVHPQHPALGVLDKVIRAIKARIPSDNIEVTFTAAEIAAAIGENEQAVGRAFHNLMEFGAGFFNQAGRSPNSEEDTFEFILFSKGNLFDYYRKYQGMEDLLERAYTRAGKDLWGTESQPVTPAHAAITADVLTPKPPEIVAHEVADARINQGSGYARPGVSFPSSSARLHSQQPQDRAERDRGSSCAGSSSGD